MAFRSEVSKIKDTLRCVPTEFICNSILESPVVKSLWENIVLSSGVESSSATPKLCLENIINLYLKVRSFSYGKDYMAKYKIEAKQTKSKALRQKGLKEEINIVLILNEDVYICIISNKNSGVTMCEFSLSNYNSFFE